VNTKKTYMFRQDAVVYNSVEANSYEEALSKLIHPSNYGKGDVEVLDNTPVLINDDEIAVLEDE
jgi:hypothetical protein